MYDGQRSASATSIQQDAALEQLLMGDLLDLLNDTHQPGSDVWLLATMDAILRILRKEFRSEESGEYLQEVLDEYPSWDRQVQALQMQHRELYHRLRELREEVARSQSQERLTEQCRMELYEWVDQVNEHNGREASLLQTALNLEVGVGD